MPEICDWINGKGGPDNLTSADIFQILDSYLSGNPPDDDALMSIDDIIVPIGSTANAHLMIKNVPKVGACDVLVHYDPSVVKIIDIIDSDFGDNCYWTDDGNGTLDIMAYTLEIYDPVLVAEIVFAPADGAVNDDYCALHLSDTFVCDSKVPMCDEVPHKTVDGSATIQGGADCINPSGPEGDTRCGDDTLGEDPTHLYRCIDGNWVDQGEDASCMPPSCTNPDGAEGAIRCGDETFGQDPTHLYQCKEGMWVDNGYDSSCDTTTGCTNPDGAEGAIRCGDETFGQDPTHVYRCVYGEWVDDGYDQSCDTQTGCNNPSGDEGDVQCGDSNYGQEPTHNYQCTDGVWYDLGPAGGCGAEQKCSNPIGYEGDIICGYNAGGQDPTHKYECMGDGTWKDLGPHPDCGGTGTHLTIDDIEICLVCSGEGTTKIHINNVSNLGSMEAKLYYDPSVIKMKSYGTEDFEQLTIVDDGIGKISIVAWTADSLDGDVIAARITFKPASGASVGDTSPLDLSEILLLDATPQGNQIPCTHTDGKATIISLGWTFVPNIQELFGVLDYYLGNWSSGDNLTGCDFTYNPSVP